MKLCLDTRSLTPQASNFKSGVPSTLENHHLVVLIAYPTFHRLCTPTVLQLLQCMQDQLWASTFLETCLPSGTPPSSQQLCKAHLFTWAAFVKTTVHQLNQEQLGTFSSRNIFLRLCPTSSSVCT